MVAAIDTAKEMDAAGQSAAKDYLESFFRAIAQPSAIKRSLVDGCKPNPTM